MTHIVICPDSFKESLSASDAAEAIEAGFRRIIPDAKYTRIPMADGGEVQCRAWSMRWEDRLSQSL